MSGPLSSSPVSPCSCRLVRLEPLGQPDDDRPAALGLRRVDRRDLHADLVDHAGDLHRWSRRRCSTRAGASATARARPSRSRSTATPCSRSRGRSPSRSSCSSSASRPSGSSSGPRRRPRRPTSGWTSRASSGGGSSSIPSFKITTANEVHLPVGQTVAFHLHAPDVIHSFWMPALGGKRDVVPHRVNRIILTPEVTGSSTSASAPSTAGCRTPTCASA